MTPGTRALVIALLLPCAHVTLAGEEPLPPVWEQARARGVVLRAVGNEPGWMFELGDDDQALLLTDYGLRRRTFNMSRHDNGMQLTATVDGKPLRASFTSASCTDTMSGLINPLRVTVMLGDKAFHGCGFDLR